MTRTIMVVGAGLMGSGITQVCAQAGIQVTMVDLNQEIVDKGYKKIVQQLEKLVAKEKISIARKEEILAKISVSTELSAGKEAEVVIEAVTENVEIKKKVFSSLDEICNSQTILASNTSTISITLLGSATKRPDKVIGMHFFIPAPVMKLIEVIPGLNTSKETYQVITDLANELGKIAVQAKDYPGFTVNRLLVPMWNEAAYMVMEGNEPKDVDTAMKLGANLPMGPLELADFAGLDTVLSVMNVLWDGYRDPKFRPCPLLIKMVEAGFLGRKSGKGFYEYDSSK